MSFFIFFPFFLIVSHSQIVTTKIGFGSCVFPNLDKSILSNIADRKHDLFLMTGDATYLDYTSIDLYSNIGILRGHFIGVPSPIKGKTNLEVENMWKSVWNKTINDPNWLKLKKNTKLLSVWDDHDYGLNDGTYVHKYRDLAQKLFLNAMDVDQNDERRKRKGVYYHYPLKINENKQIIDIILLDIRYFAKEDGIEDILGNTQWKWFQDILNNKLNGNLLLIASGIQIMPILRKKTAEGWSRFKSSQNKLFELLYKIKTEKKQEILLISGDVHRGEIMQTVCKSKQDEKSEYVEFLELTSSGLTHSVGNDAPFVVRNLVHLSHILDADGITKCLWRGINFGEINIKWNDNNIINITIDIFDDKFKSKCSHTMEPMINQQINWNDRLDDNKYTAMLETKDVHCYGTVKLYSKNEKYVWELILESIYTLVMVVPLLALALVYVMIRCLYVCSKTKSKTKIA